MIKMIYLPEYWILRSDSWTNKDINTFVLDWNQNYTHFCAISPSLMDLILVKLSDEEIQFPLIYTNIRKISEEVQMERYNLDTRQWI